MAQNRVAYFNVPGIFSPHRLTIRFPAAEKEGSQGEPSAAQSREERKQVDANDPAIEGPLGTRDGATAGQKRKEREVEFLKEEIALNALELAAESEVFEKLFTSELQGSEHPVVTVESPAEKDALIELLRFCYTKALPNEVASDKESLLTALLLADRYAVANAIPVIIAALKKVATLDDACRYLDLPRSITSQEAFQELMLFCKQFLGNEMANLDEAYRTGKYEKLTLRGLWYALLNDQAVAVCEHTVFAMAWKWTRARRGSTTQHFHRLSSLISYHHMTSSFLVAIQQLPECKHPSVATSIRRALLVRGLPDDTRGVFLASKGLKPRPGFISPLSVELDWVVDHAVLESLEVGGILKDVGVKAAFGYNFNCSLGRSEKNLEVYVAFTLFCFEVEDVEASIVFEARFQLGEERYDEALIVERLKQGKAGNFITVYPWVNEHGESLEATHVVNRKLRGKILLTLV